MSVETLLFLLALQKKIRRAPFRLLLSLFSVVTALMAVLLLLFAARDIVYWTHEVPRRPEGPSGFVLLYRTFLLR
ncbi:hypothetical protein EI42_04762 [Thermosporothrix hazakensis]|jgi:hypothetical protein|uniref:ABC transport system permease protein n=1 Tax=Thermosporothrix hazakensis TaxID=644383 RepID=A0A326U9Y4_THEHA|nr:hypothetical protein [Thermosporothrix hazakensis]PZW24071.1 hypothetical protein EI42_04762 [Thermosporothrix hazakensis]